jgi:hypothetical protein
MRGGKKKKGKSTSRNTSISKRSPSTSVPDRRCPLQTLTDGVRASSWRPSSWAMIRDHLILPYLFGDFHPSHIQEYAGGLLFALEKPAKDGGPDVRTCSTSMRCSISRFVSSRKSFMPMITLSGVRSSRDNGNQELGLGLVRCQCFRQRRTVCKIRLQDSVESSQTLGNAGFPPDSPRRNR